MSSDAFLKASIALRQLLRDQVAAKVKHPSQFTQAVYQNGIDHFNAVTDEQLRGRLRPLQDINRNMIQAAISLDSGRLEREIRAQERGIRVEWPARPEIGDAPNTEVELEPVRYDPTREQPKTLGQLWSFADHLERRRSNRDLPLVVVLADETLAGMDRLRAYSAAKYGEPGPYLLSAANIQRMTGQLALDRGISMKEAEATLLQDAADFFAPLARPQRGKAGAKPKAAPARPTEARDKWIYGQCCKGTPHDKIAACLKSLAAKRKWKIVSTKQRIQQIGNEYAERHGLDRPPPRQNL